MNKFLLFGLEHKLITAIVILGITIYAVMGFDTVRSDFHIKAMTNEETFEEYEDSVGGYEVKIRESVFVKFKEPLHAGNLQLAWDFQEALSGLQGVEEVESIFTEANYYHTGEYLNIGPAVPDIDESPAIINQQLQEATENMMFKHRYISEDKTALVFNLVINQGYFYHLGPKTFKTNIESLIHGYKSQFSDAFLIGELRLKQDNIQLVTEEFKILLPFAAAIFMFITYFFYQSILACINPIIIASLTTVWTFGLMGHMDIPVNPMTVIIPILFFVISSTEDIHLFSYYSHTYRHVLSMSSKQMACDIMLKKVGKSTLLMVITTFLGFFISTFNGNKMLSDFSYAAAFGIAVNGILTLYLSPIIYSMIGNIGPEKTNMLAKLAKKVNETIYRKIYRVLNKHVYKLLAGLALLVVYSIYSISNMQFSDNPISFFDEDNQLVKDSKMYNNHFSGQEHFRIKLTLRSPDHTFSDPVVLKQVDEMSVLTAERPEWDAVDSLTNIMKHVYREANNGDPAYYRTPETIEAVESIFSIIGNSSVQKYLVEDDTELHLTVMHHIPERADLKVYSDNLESLLTHKFGNTFVIQFSNLDLINFEVSKQVVVNQAYALVIMLVLIALVFTFLFSSIWIGLISLVPNLIPVTVAIGLMPLLGINFTVMTSIVVLVGVGLAVDDTIHFITKYQDFCQSTRSNQEAIHETLKHEIPPIVTTSCALILGFLCLLISDYKVAADFGVMLAITILFATIVDLVVTPILVAKFRFVNIWDLMNLEISKTIQKSALFTDLYNYEIKIIKGLSVVEHYKAGSKISYPKDEEAIFFILSGKVTCTANKKQHVQSKPGSLLAVSNMLLGKSYEPKLEVNRAAKILIIHRPALLSLAYHYPRISYKLVRNLLKILAKQKMSVPDSIDTTKKK